MNAPARTPRPATPQGRPAHPGAEPVPRRAAAVTRRVPTSAPPPATGRASRAGEAAVACAASASRG